MTRLILLLAAAAMLGCNDHPVSAGIPQGSCGYSTGPCIITIQPKDVVLTITDTMTFTATLSPGWIDRRIVWSSSDASKVEVDSLGRAHAFARTPGVEVCAASMGRSACTTVTVFPPRFPP